MVKKQKTVKGFMFYMDSIAESIGMIMRFFMQGFTGYRLDKAYGYGFIGFILLIVFSLLRSFFVV